MQQVATDILSKIKAGLTWDV